MIARWLRRIAVILVPLLIIMGIGAFVLLRAGRLNDYLRAALISQLTESVERKVSIERAELVRPGVLQLTGVRIAGRRPDLPPLLTVRAMTIRFRWRSLVLGGEPAISTLERLTVIGPEATIIRRADGHWEDEDLITPRKPRVGRFLGTVEVVRGQITLEDHAAPAAAGRPAVNHLSQVRAVVSTSKDGTSVFSIAGRGRDRFDAMMAQGASASDRLVVDARVTGADLAYAWRYLNISSRRPR
jgi:hypothetical protein